MKRYPNYAPIHEKDVFGDIQWGTSFTPLWGITRQPHQKAIARGDLEFASVLPRTFREARTLSGLFWAKCSWSDLLVGKLGGVNSTLSVARNAIVAPL